jgi:hypothetical protein
MKKDASHEKESKTVTSADQDRRRFERRKVDLPATIGDAHSDPRDFEMGTVLDISVGGIRFSVPKGMTVQIQTDSETSEFSVIFTLPNNSWRTNLICRPQRISESEEDVQIGAAVVNPDYFYTTALRKYLM